MKRHIIVRTPLNSETKIEVYLGRIKKIKARPVYRWHR